MFLPKVKITSSADIARFFAVFCANFCLIEASIYEKQLIESLMRDYNNLERPVENHSHPVVVRLKVSLQQIIDLDEKNQIVYVNAWLDYVWNDYNLRWDPEQYGNISDVRFPAGKIWKPDVLLYNSVDSNFDSTYQTNMIVYNTGDVSWVPPGIFKIACKIDITWFPFDEQRCFFKFGSWTYNGLMLDLQPAKGGFDTSEYISNGEWALPMTTVSRSEKFYDCCPKEPYPDLTFYLHMRRRTLYYGFNLIMPCILTTAMSLIGFTLPPESGEKITLQITVLLSIIFFLSIISEMSPPTSEAVPLLGLFFSACMIIVTASTLFTVYVLNLHYRTPETHEMGVTTRTILLYWLPFLLRMERPGVHLTWATLPPLLFWSKPKLQSESLMRNIKDSESGVRYSIDTNMDERGSYIMPTSQFVTGLVGNGRCKNGGEEFKSIINRIKSYEQANEHMRLASHDTNTHSILIHLQRIHRELRMITKRMIEADREGEQSSNWKYAAIVVDRLCLYTFGLLMLGTVGAVLISAPYIIA